MPKISETFSGKWMRADDVGRGIRAVIEEVVEENVGTGDKKENKLVLYMKGQEKGLVLNKTNGNALAEIYGDDTDGWAGKRIILKSEKVPFQGKIVPGIRVDDAAIRAANESGPVSKNGPERSRKPAEPVTQEEADIPF